ncbi:hypothetical protein [Flavobacterium xinjiangense]|uniref:Uncharacterized protein n=1 Tax=Flavobacterium xinjiangense TaxID=178356 RepID=A0A1M7PN67_9FLAO|nr:hypothetical protein [Flavobacterium xinjiangense]SHN18686.1 hypothetical protein SAMN05216269_12012 [Flavobacterium xinjiangense]
MNNKLSQKTQSLQTCVSDSAFSSANEYDKINSFFSNEINIYEQECLKSNVSVYFCYNSLMYKFQKYADEKNKIKLIERLDFTDKNRVKVLLNKASFSSKKEELKLATENFALIKHDLFEWLDKTKNPYFFILHPFFKFGSGINYIPIPYKKDNMSGVQNTDIACDYANYVLFG